jgi:hypothetical protein
MNRPKSCENCCRFSHCNNNDLYCLSVAKDILDKKNKEDDCNWHRIKADDGYVYKCMSCDRKVTEGIYKNVPRGEEIKGIDSIHLYGYNQTQFQFLCRACAYNYHIEVED